MMQPLINQSQPSKKIHGGTISHSQKSLRSQTSSRKRVGSMDSSAGMKKLVTGGGETASKYNLQLMGDSSSSQKKSGKLNTVHSGHLTPDLTNYNQKGKKAQKLSGNPR